jgi:hypothetical protein
VHRLANAISIFLYAALSVPLLVHAQTSNSKSPAKESTMSLHAEGTFDVKNAPLTADEALAGTTVGR